MTKMMGSHPFKSFRKEQETAINSCITAVKKGYKYIILEAPTGSGKSAIAVEILRHLGSGRILTPQVILQNQYKADYPEFKVLKGASRYWCHMEGPPKRIGDIPTPKSQWIKSAEQKTCAESSKWFNKRIGAFGRCRNCVYEKALKETAEAKYSILNYHSFYYQNKMRKGLFNDSNLVLDEAHNIGKIVTGLFERTFEEEPFIQFNIPDNSICFNNRDFTISKAVDIIEEQFVKDLLDAYIFNIEKEILSLEAGSITPSLKKIIGTYKEKLSQAKFQRKNVNLKFFSYTFFEENGIKKLTSKPIDVKGIIKAQFFDPNKVIIFMSATILDKTMFCLETGLDENDTFHYNVPDSFDSSKHTSVLYFDKNGPSMAYSSRKRSLPEISRAIKEILKKHPNEKGIIHTQNFNILNFLVISNQTSRFTYKASSREKLLQKHRTKPRSVLLAPGMKEGVNLAGAESTFQILVCIPFPVFNHYNMCKFAFNPGYKEWVTSIELLQSLGRSVRTSNDTCTTYFLDSRFCEFLPKVKTYFSKYQQDILNV